MNKTDTPARTHEILESMKELRNALTGAQHVLHNAGLDDALVSEFQRMNVRNGVGVRAETLIRQLESTEPDDR